MNNQAIVLPFPGPLPTRSVIYSRVFRGALRVEVIDEVFQGQHRFYVVTTALFTDVTTLTGPLFSRWEALAMAHTGGM